jgi:hypothetical protein
MRAGFTRRVIVELGDNDYYGWIRPITDFGATFTMIEDDTGKVRNIVGGDATVRDLDD